MTPTPPQLRWGGRLCEVALPLRLFLQLGAFLGQYLGEAFGREAHVDEARPDIGDFPVFRDASILQAHDCNAFKADALALSLRQSRNVAERIVGIERPAVAHRP